MTAVVQIFYAYKIKLLANSYFIPIVVVSVKICVPPSRMAKCFYLQCALVQLGGGIAVGVIETQMSLFSHLLVKETLIASGVCAPSSSGAFSNFRLTNF